MAADQAVIAIENVRLFDEIQDKNRQLAEASEHKSQFVASMSHELRTPLNAIIGLTEMMVKNAARFGTEKAQEPLQRVNRAGTHLLGLINQVLDLSKIEAGKLELNPQTVQLAPLINDVISTAGQLINDDDIPHTVASSSKLFKSKPLDTEDKFSFTFTTPGSYEYFCSIHPHMTGAIVVEAATGSSAAQ